MSAEKTTTPAEHEVKPKQYRLRRSLGWLGLTATVLETIYLVPIDIVKHNLSETQARIVKVADATDPLTNTSVYVVGGWGVKNSVPDAQALPQLSQLGEVNAVVQDNRGVSDSALADRILDNAQASHHTHVILVGESMGGLLVDAAAVKIDQSSSDVQVDAIINDCTPVEEEALRENWQNTIQMTADWDKVLPDVELHPVFEAAYTDIELGHNPLTLPSGINGAAVIDKLNDPNTPSTSLLWSEASYVLDSHFADDMKQLDATRNKKRAPFMAFERPDTNTDDQIVNTTKDTSAIERALSETSIAHRTYKSGKSHADPTAPWNRQQDDATLQNEIIPDIEAYLHPVTPRQISGHTRLQ